MMNTEIPKFEDRVKSDIKDMRRALETNDWDLLQDKLMALKSGIQDSAVYAKIVKNDAEITVQVHDLHQESYRISTLENDAVHAMNQCKEYGYLQDDHTYFYRDERRYMVQQRRPGIYTVSELEKHTVTFAFSVSNDGEILIVLDADHAKGAKA